MANVIPDRRGGKFSAQDGMSARLADRARFETLVNVMVQPVLITLSLDRDALGSPEAGHEAASPKVSELMRQLGVTLWGRVVEVQSESGDGWSHWHVVADFAGTAFDLSAVKRRPWVDLGALQAEVKRWWCDVWKLGQRPGQDIQRVKSRGGVVGYLCKYVVKPWPAIPTWVGERRFLRTVGFSKAANEHFRRVGMVKDRSGENDPDDDHDHDSDGKGGESGPDAPPTPKKHRATSTIFERVASSGLTCKLVTEDGYVGQIPCRLGDLLCRTGHGAPLEIVKTLYRNCYSECHRVAWVIRGVTRAMLDRLARWAHVSGVVRECKAEYERRLDYLRNSWWLMQACREFA